MMTYESVLSFVEQCINYASRDPEYAMTYETQAFGAVSFVCQQVWQSDPELERKLAEMWNDEWRNLFTQLYL